MKSSIKLIAVLVPVALLAAGCVSTSKFETAVSDVTTRVDSIQSTVEEQGERIDQLAKKDEQLESQISSVDQKATTAQQAGQQAIAKAEQAEKLARGKVLWQVTLTNNDVRFGVDKVELSDNARAVLDELAARIKSMDRIVYLEIQGHTDATGSESYNYKLGLKRAEAVRDYLHEQGIPLHLMEAISYGETRPIADNKTAEGRAANRRVEILVLE
ncbi:MAG: hypothetical protein Kow0062_16030 [Acidobacteriota bacterium]